MRGPLSMAHGVNLLVLANLTIEGNKQLNMVSLYGT